MMKLLVRFVIVLIVLDLAAPALAQERQKPAAASGEQRIALVIGNSLYKDSPLPNPVTQNYVAFEFEETNWKGTVYKKERTELLACGRKLKFIAVIEQPDVIEKILKHLGLDPQAPPISPARRELFEAA